MLDLLRGFAAIAVVLYHGDRLVPAGYLAVDLFFILSGFVLAHAYRGRLHSRQEISSFLLKRAIRLYPVMFLGALVGLAINGGSLKTLLLIPEADGVLYPANLPLWSLLFEAIASVAFGLFHRFGKLMLAAFFFVGLLVFALGVLKAGTADLGFFSGAFGVGLGRTAFGFSAGIVIYYLCRRRHPVSTYLAVWCCLTIVAVTFLQPGSPLLELLVVTVVLPLAIFVLAHLQPASNGLAVWLGNLSYPLYAIHHPVIKLAEGSVVAVLCASIALVLASAAIYRWYDVPVRRWLEKRLALSA
ncbi:acyltransferase family protein [Aurantiacibacter odishensis]|uniref:acyltransferase family protein n=1 Tax=Aurantiacibacter odishensis TaxID=1155476 RepID=UPI0013C495D2|nr:acyltransferase [Aurantiacibacter odishensis]